MIEPCSLIILYSRDFKLSHKLMGESFNLRQVPVKRETSDEHARSREELGY